MTGRPGAALAALLLTIGLAVPAGAAEPAKAEPCGACHGADGNSATEGIPSLAGQPAYYLLMQLVLQRDKQRVVEAMLPFVENMTDADAEALAAHFAAQELKPQPGPADPALMETGKRLAEANHCGQCHLPDFRGREQMARLAGQREEYLLKALQDFKAGRRAGFDGTMTEAVYNLAETDLPALAHYLARQP